MVLHWREVRYYRKVEDIMKARGLYVPVLEMQGTDRDFCIMSLKMYRAGFESGLAPSKVATAVVQASSVYRLDRKRGMECMERLVGKEQERTESPNSHSDPSPVSALTSLQQEKVEENLRIIFSVTDQVLDEIGQELDTAGGSRLEGPLGTFGQGLAKMLRTDVALLIFGIHAICKIRHNSTYLSSEEHAGTKSALLDNVAAQSRRMLGRMGMKESQEQAFRANIHAEILECESSVRDFCLQLRAGNTSSPDAALIANFVKRTATKQISGRTIESLIHDYLRVVYDLIYTPRQVEP